MSIFETLYLSPFKGDRPPPAAIHWIGPDESILEATELGNLARVFNQDTYNMPSVQKGLHTLALDKPGVTLAAYQETKLRHFFRSTSGTWAGCRDHDFAHSRPEGLHAKHRLRHPLSGAYYAALSEDLISVEKDGREGLFTGNGIWISGGYRPGRSRVLSVDRQLPDSAEPGCGRFEP